MTDQPCSLNIHLQDVRSENVNNDSPLAVVGLPFADVLGVKPVDDIVLEVIDEVTVIGVGGEDIVDYRHPVGWIMQLDDFREWVKGYGQAITQKAYVVDVDSNIYGIDVSAVNTAYIESLRQRYYFDQMVNNLTDTQLAELVDILDGYVVKSLDVTQEIPRLIWYSMYFSDEPNRIEFDFDFSN